MIPVTVSTGKYRSAQTSTERTTFPHMWSQDLRETKESGNAVF